MVKMIGYVKSFDNNKGYGFLQYYGQDIFIHYSNILEDGFKTLHEGDLVEFQLLETSKGLQALGIKRIKESVR